MRASKPAGDEPFWDAPSPVTSVMYAMVIGAGDADACPAAPAVTPNVINDRNRAPVRKTRLIIRFLRIFPPW
jgi:hypothetical protein